jgi:hypothetical protein
VITRMEGTEVVPAVGLLLVNGTSCLPAQLRQFLESNQSDRPTEGNNEPPECIKFHILPASSVAAAMLEVRASTSFPVDHSIEPRY